MYSTLDPHVLQRLRELQRIGTPELIDELIDLFLCHTPALFGTLRDAIADEDRTAFDCAVQRLRGSSAAIGALNLTALCSGLEARWNMRHSTSMTEHILRMESEYRRLTVELEREREKLTAPLKTREVNRR